MIEHRGVNYDVGTVMGTNWRPDYDPKTVERELEAIKNGLHCNAVGISGKDIDRVILTAEAALRRGLEAWLHPSGWVDKSAEFTLAYIAEAAKAAQPLHERYPGKVVFGVGGEFTLFLKGIVPGNFIRRVRIAVSADSIESGKYNRSLNDFLGTANAAVRQVFDGPVMYRSLAWEQVDWSIFDMIGVDHYWGEKIKDRYIDMVKPLFTYGKPVINTGFGFNTTNTPVVGMASTLGDLPFFSILFHQMPGIGRLVRPRLKVISERDEALQAKRLADNLKLIDKAGFSGAFMDTFISSHYPYSDVPKYDLDRAGSSLVKYFEGGRHGTTYPDMTWEPKEAFRAVAEYYAQKGEKQK